MMMTDVVPPGTWDIAGAGSDVDQSFAASAILTEDHVNTLCAGSRGPSPNPELTPTDSNQHPNQN